jgi:hypothetical protein
MQKRKSVQGLLLSAVIILVICVLAGAISLTTHQPINQTPREPAGLPGIEIVIVKKGSLGARPQSVLTDSQGRFSFDVLPAGTYALNLRLPDATASQMQTKAGGVTTSANIAAARVTLEGTTEGTIVRGWDFKEKRTLDLSRLPTQDKVAGVQTSKADINLRSASPPRPPEPDILFTTDGKQKVTGKAHHDTAMNSIQNMG